MLNKTTVSSVVLASALAGSIVNAGEGHKPAPQIKVSCPTANLEEYRKVAMLAKELGATHLAADQIEPSMWQWNLDRRDPYPNWSIQRPTLFKYIVPKELKAYLPEEYANRNLEMLRKRVEIIKEFGLKTVFSGMEPAYLPEKAYREHPEWRGPRCDHPRRSRKEYYAPCLDNPEMRRIYVDTVAELCRVAPFESFELMTNDSGGGLCWYPKLYPGMNGPSCCYSVPLATRIVNMLSIFQEGAAKAGLSNVKVNLSRYFRQEEVRATLPFLKPNQFLMGQNASGKSPRSLIGYMSTHQEHTFPVYCLSRMVKIASQLQTAQEHPEYDMNIVLRGLDEFDTIRFLRKFLKKKITAGQAGVYAALNEFAADLVGSERAPKLVEAWDLVERAYDALEGFNTGGHLFTLGTVHQRWLTRPLVMFPGELKPEEKNYYRQFQFQAQTEADADNLLDLQGYRWLSGYGAYFLYNNIYWTSVAPRLSRAANLLSELIPASLDSETKHYLELQTKKVQLYQCIAYNALNVIHYQEILDRTDYKRVPVDTTFDAFEQGDEQLYKLERILRDDINNTVRIIRLLESTTEPLLIHASSDDMESVMVLGTRRKLLDDLNRKIDIMENHRREPERLYKSYNR